jgi:holin-like protein
MDDVRAIEIKSNGQRRESSSTSSKCSRKDEAMLKGLAGLLVFQLAGELTVALFQLPVSGPIVGMALLLIWLQGRGRIDDGLQSAADGLLSNMAILFVPVGVGAMAYPDLFREYWLFILVSVTAGTAVTVTITALTAKILIGMRLRAVRRTDAAA